MNQIAAPICRNNCPRWNCACYEPEEEPVYWHDLVFELALAIGLAFIFAYS